MTIETDITTSWTASAGKDGWVQFTCWGSGAGGNSDVGGGGGGSSGVRAVATVFASLDEVFTITRGTFGLLGSNGNHSQVARADGTIVCKAAGGIKATGATGGISDPAGSIGDTITAGGNGTNAGGITGGNGGNAPGGGTGGAGGVDDDGVSGTAPGGGGGGGGTGGIGGSGGLGRVNVEYPVPAPVKGFATGLGFGSILGNGARY